MDWQPFFILVVVVMFVLLAGGVWIGIATALAGLIGLYITSGTQLMRGLAIINFNTANSFTLTAVPMFIFMGEVVLFSGVSARFYKGVSTWLQWLPGGLLHSNIVACAGFAAISGSSVACAATIGSVAVPEMVRRGYNRSFLFGSLAAGGTLGILIPPSIPMVVYGVSVSQSVAELFMAGVVPGILLALMFIVYILVRVKIQPDLATRETISYSWRDRLASLKDILPVTLLSLLVLGGIYLGWTTPTEAAALGACGALIIAAAYRTLSFKSLKESLVTTVRTTCMVILIVTGSLVFSFALVSADVPRNLVTWMVSFNLTPITFFVGITIVYSILGCFIEGLSMMLITLPIVYPLVLQMGFNPIWFGVYMVMQLELALITPPVGVNLFVIQGISQGRPLTEVIKGAFPYCFMLLFLMVLTVISPNIVLWLPAHMRR